ncbi:uncharacterized protein LOC121429413 [Lytechinus variegatus]|uniref:uncharacterized protein LOC121429413 n=1 Tax=Lytechinus variegatus TaxID=7654 RepID=UPI001BB1CCB9|nr:uncharacterized protein LOC121429413 [Lytechinus variegatus]
MADCQSSPVRIMAWIMPRTISTALCKCLSSVDGMEIWFELFSYASFVRKEYEQQTGNKLPMVYEGNEKTVRDAAKRFESLVGTNILPEKVVYHNVQKELEASTSKYIFVKEGYMAFPDKKSRQYLPKGFKHVFLIREPHKLFTSYRKAMYQHLTNVGIRSGDAADEEAFDIGHDDPVMNANEFYSGITDLWLYVRDNLDPNPIVINTDDLLADPAGVLEKFCNLTGLPYSDSLLHWDASPDVIKNWIRVSDNIIKLANAFFETAVLSSSFLPPKPAIPIDKLSPDVRKLAKVSMPHFEKINQFKI